MARVKIVDTFNGKTSFFGAKEADMKWEVVESINPREALVICRLQSGSVACYAVDAQGEITYDAASSDPCPLPGGLWPSPPKKHVQDAKDLAQYNTYVPGLLVGYAPAATSRNHHPLCACLARNPAYNRLQ